jgi:hypothetical protein
MFKYTYIDGDHNMHESQRGKDDHKGAKVSANQYISMHLLKNIRRTANSTHDVALHLPLSHSNCNTESRCCKRDVYESKKLENH